MNSSRKDVAAWDSGRLSLVLAASELGDWRWDAKTDIVTLSERAAEIFGFPPQPHMTWTALRELIYPDDRESARQAFEKAVEEHGDYACDHRLIIGTHSTCSCRAARRSIARAVVWVWASRSCGTSSSGMVAA